MKIIKRTRRWCDLCGRNGRLTEIELHNGDHVLKCLKCNKVEWGVTYDIHKRYATVKPLEEINFKSQKQVYNRCVKILSEL